MNSNREYGQTEPAPVHVLPELVFDLSEGEQLPATLGQTEVPVIVLPEVAFDLIPEPAAVNTDHGIPATRGDAGAGGPRPVPPLHSDESTGTYPPGAGLVPDDASSEGTPSNGTMRITFKPVEPDGAAERLAAIVTAIGEAQTEYSSIERCEATVLAPAA